MLILCESTICFEIVPEGLSNKIIRLVLTIFGCELEFNGAKKSALLAQWGFPCCYVIAAKCAKNEVICLRLGGLLLLQLLSRHEGWGSLKKTQPRGRGEDVLQLFCGWESSAADKNSAEEICFRCVSKKLTSLLEGSES